MSLDIAARRCVGGGGEGGGWVGLIERAKNTGKRKRAEGWGVVPVAVAVAVAVERAEHRAATLIQS